MPGDGGPYRCKYRIKIPIQKKRRLSGALGGLLGGWGCQVAVMMLWNYLVAPVYMGYSREAVAQLLLPAFLPFNVIKGGG